MQKAKKLTLAVLIQAALISTVYASEQSESKGFVEDAEGSVLFRTGYLSRDKKNGVDDTSSFAQTAIVNLDSGYTQGLIGFGVGVVGDASFKLGENKHAGNGMIPRETGLNSQGQLTKGAGDTYDHWTRGGANVKARVSNTDVRYGTQVLDLPVLASNTARLVPEYFDGFLVTSREIKGLELTAGKFTKNQYSDQINSDGNELGHYANVNFKQSLANNSSLTYDFSGYHTEWDRGANSNLYSFIGPADGNYQNSIWAVSGTYNKGPHNVMLAYQQNSGNTGYDYGLGRGVGDGHQTIYMPNSYLSDFIGNDEKSAQIQYTYDFGAMNVPGLTWTSAFVYGWDIKATDNKGTMISDNAQEREFFNQVKYTVQSGFAKDASLRLRNSYYRASNDYQSNYIGDTNEWRIFLDIPVKLF